MSESSNKPPRGLLRGNRAWLWLSLLVLVADQISKWLVVREIAPLRSIPLLPHFNLINLHNTGAAFSSFSAAPALVFVILALAVTAGILYWLRENPHGQRLLAIGFCLILGGALGNALDRLTRGYVVDFIDFHIGRWHFAAFNIADSAISVGVAFLLLDMLVDRLRRRRADPKAEPRR
jgi:lipoprotein signal peptidase